MIVPTDRHYTAEHEWITVGDDVATVGITAFAADSLGDIVYVDLPPAGAALIAGRPCGEIESTKSVSDLYAPVDGSVLDVNPLLADEPSLLNQDPFGAGWLLRVRIDGSIDGRALLDATAYAALIRDAG